MGSLSLADAQATAAARGGRCLSTAYVRAKAALLWQCAAGHRFTKSFMRVRAGQWCPVCSALTVGVTPKKPRLTRANAAVVLGELLADRGATSPALDIHRMTDRVQVRCSSGHTWRPQVRRLLAGDWCPFCATDAVTAQARERAGILPLLTRDEVARWAAERGFSFVVPFGGPPTGRVYFFRCGTGHLWEGRKRTGVAVWCPACGLRGEALPEGRIVP